MTHNLYLRTVRVYLLVGLVLLLSLYFKTPLIFFAFVILSTIINKGKAFVSISKEDLTLKYALFNLFCLVLTVLTVFITIISIT